MVVFGIATCDTVRKALAALRRAGHDVRLRDIRAEPLTGPEWQRLIAVLGEAIVNRASATWRALDPAARAGSAESILSRHPAAMKRPVIESDGVLYLGWSPDVQAALLGTAPARG